MFKTLISHRFLYTFRLGRWLLMKVLVPLDILETNIYFGVQGKCPFCGKLWTQHHVQERTEALAKLDRLKDEVRAAQAHKFEREHHCD